MPEIPRNSKCPCGSGKKYKRCCGMDETNDIEKSPKAWEAVKLKMFKIESPFPKELSKDQKFFILKKMGEKAQEEFENNFTSLTKWFSIYDPTYLLAFCEYYFLASEEGVDEEAIKGKLDIYPHYLEILQCLALFQDRVYSAKPLDKDVIKFKKNIQGFGESLGMRYYNFPRKIDSEKEIHAYSLRLEMMISTLAIRNWAYEHQMLKISYELSSYVSEPFLKEYGFEPKLLLDILFKLVEKTNDKLNAHRQRVINFAKENDLNEILNAYEKNFPHIEKLNPEKRQELFDKFKRNKRTLIGMLIYHSDLKLSDIFTFDIKEIKSILLYEDDAKIEKVLNEISFQFGELRSYNRDYIFLNNPVLLKPFIKIEDKKYFCSIIGLFPHMGLGIVENLIDKNKTLKEAYSQRKALYLENKLYELFKVSFPNAQIFSGSIWNCPETGKRYENDIIVLVENFAIIIEAKSGTVTGPAKRGAPDRLFKTLKELIEEPSQQAIRFLNYLKNNPAIHNFKNKNGGINVINSKNIKYFIPLGVTLSNLGSIGSNLKKLVDAEIVTKNIEELAPSISYSDLEVIFELLPFEAQKIHYLARRREFEAHVIYQGDELDLFGFYLDTGFNIGDDEYTRELHMNFSLKSKELDPYIVGSRRGKEVIKPELSMTQWWKDLLSFMAVRKGQIWLQASFILLNASKDDQIQFENGLKKMKNLILTNKTDKPHNWVQLVCGPKRRRYIIVGYPYRNIDKETRNKIIDQILQSEDDAIRGILIIGQNINTADYPYTVLAGTLDNNLFDSLQIETSKTDD
jgi:hypothetical protein